MHEAELAQKAVERNELIAEHAAVDAKNADLLNDASEHEGVLFDAICGMVGGEGDAALTMLFAELAKKGRPEFIAEIQRHQAAKEERERDSSADDGADEEEGDEEEDPGAPVDEPPHYDSATVKEWEGYEGRKRTRTTEASPQDESEDHSLSIPENELTRSEVFCEAVLEFLQRVRASDLMRPAMEDGASRTIRTDPSLADCAAIYARDKKSRELLVSLMPMTSISLHKLVAGQPVAHETGDLMDMTSAELQGHLLSTGASCKRPRAATMPNKMEEEKEAPRRVSKNKQLIRAYIAFARKQGEDIGEGCLALQAGPKADSDTRDLRLADMERWLNSDDAAKCTFTFTFAPHEPGRVQTYLHAMRNYLLEFRPQAEAQSDDEPSHAQAEMDVEDEQGSEPGSEETCLQCKEPSRKIAHTCERRKR